jgi:hypothetical protein
MSRLIAKTATHAPRTNASRKWAAVKALAYAPLDVRPSLTTVRNVTTETHVPLTCASAALVLDPALAPCPCFATTNQLIAMITIR